MKNRNWIASEWLVDENQSLRNVSGRARPLCCVWLRVVCLNRWHFAYDNVDWRSINGRNTEHALAESIVRSHFESFFSFAIFAVETEQFPSQAVAAETFLAENGLAKIDARPVEYVVIHGQSLALIASHITPTGSNRYRFFFAPQPNLTTDSAHKTRARRTVTLAATRWNRKNNQKYVHKNKQLG